MLRRDNAKCCSAALGAVQWVLVEDVPSLNKTYVVVSVSVCLLEIGGLFYEVSININPLAPASQCD